MKINKLNVLNATLIAAVTLAASGQVYASDYEKTTLKLVEESKTERFIVKGVNGGLSGNELIEALAKSCASDNHYHNNTRWSNADKAGREKLMEEARVITRKTLEKYDNIGAKRIGVFFESYFWVFAPKGTVKRGDQIIAKVITTKGHPFADCPSSESFSIAIGVDRVIKQEDRKNSGSGNFKSSFLD